MAYKQCFIWVEGATDALFFDTIVKPIFAQRYDFVKIVPYANKTKAYVDKFLKSIEAMPADYIFVTDIDMSPCITHKKDRQQKDYKRLDSNRIVVVIKEIESWYVAGLDEHGLKELGLQFVGNTDGLTKEQFEKDMPKKFNSRIDFLVELLKYFSLDAAQSNNQSFRYFIQRYTV